MLFEENLLVWHKLCFDTCKHFEKGGDHKGAIKCRVRLDSGEENIGFYWTAFSNKMI